ILRHFHEFSKPTALLCHGPIALVSVMPHAREFRAALIAVKTIAILVAKHGMAEELRALLDGMVVPSRAEPGNLQYNLWRDHVDIGSFVLEELYTDDGAVAAHHATPHFAKYLSKINDLAERTVMRLDPLVVDSRPNESTRSLVTSSDKEEM